MRLLKQCCLLGLLMSVCAGCATMYYETMEQLGVHKRDILVDNVEEARDSQEEAKEQFQSALDEFLSVVNYAGGDLKAKHDSLNTQLERSEARAREVRDRIADVDRVGEALFREWEAELDLYSSESLRTASEQKLNDTRDRYDGLMAAMRRAESKLEPALIPLRDHVLYLKHNLNAQAIASLQDELVTVETDVGSLIAEMEAAIQEADEFIRAMDSGAST